METQVFLYLVHLVVPSLGMDLGLSGVAASFPTTYVAPADAVKSICKMTVLVNLLLLRHLLIITLGKNKWGMLQ